MIPELQKQHENMNAYDMIVHLKKVYSEQARQERYDVSKAMFGCKLAEGSPVGAHVLKMIGYVENLDRLGFSLGQELATDLILQSLPGSYKQFIMNYNMNETDKTLPELLSMLRTAEQSINNRKAVMTVSKTKTNGNERSSIRNPKASKRARALISPAIPS